MLVERLPRDSSGIKANSRRQRFRLVRDTPTKRSGGSVQPTIIYDMISYVARKRKGEDALEHRNLSGASKRTCQRHAMGVRNTVGTVSPELSPARMSKAIGMALQRREGFNFHSVPTRGFISKRTRLQCNRNPATDPSSAQPSSIDTASRTGLSTNARDNSGVTKAAFAAKCRACVAHSGRSPDGANAAPPRWSQAHHRPHWRRESLAQAMCNLTRLIPTPVS
ncbi:hypothetical protein BDV96DRAFT_606259 [Lophiotrema nucula]|uniref:Uncharacterized protein n=1 Tax=Lophiotrema nucula TaxID=690887 RepID=A0A6A5YLX2_9PLEO|nr:hypothetical protein BDV96DRAFT_606259 [Lophiotrema nucula]